jgi:hypothetical protein
MKNIKGYLKALKEFKGVRNKWLVTNKKLKK